MSYASFMTHGAEVIKFTRPCRMPFLLHTRMKRQGHDPRPPLIVIRDSISPWI